MEFGGSNLSLRTLPDLHSKVAQVEGSGRVARDWYYAPIAESLDFMTDSIGKWPHADRIFGLPKTHTLQHTASTGPEHMRFLVWMLGFVLGIRLTEGEAGFLDATSLKPGMLHDISWPSHSALTALAVIDRFWHRNTGKPGVAKGLVGVVHSLFLGQTPTLLDFEMFIYLYTALDGCHAARCAIAGDNPVTGGHRSRIDKLCSEFQRATPDWADPTSNQAVRIRNDTLHEGLFFDEPLGFRLYERKPGTGSTERNILLEMRNLICRLVYARLGFQDASYITSALDTRTRVGVRL